MKKVFAVIISVAVGYLAYQISLPLASIIAETLVHLFIGEVLQSATRITKESVDKGIDVIIFIGLVIKFGLPVLAAWVTYGQIRRLQLQPAARLQ